MLDGLARKAREDTRDLVMGDRGRTRHIVNGLAGGVEQRRCRLSYTVLARHIRAAWRLRCGHQFSGLKGELRKPEDDFRVQIVPQYRPIEPALK